MSDAMSFQYLLEESPGNPNERIKVAHPCHIFACSAGYASWENVLEAVLFEEKLAMGRLPGWDSSNTKHTDIFLACAATEGLTIIHNHSMSKPTTITIGLEKNFAPDVLLAANRDIEELFSLDIANTNK